MDAAVVLVHGLSATKDNRELVAVATNLQARGLDVLAYDARGHGGSSGICTLGDATSSENGLDPNYYQFLLTGGSGLSGKVPDTRINGAIVGSRVYRP